ncbi:MAG TPA: hypothetical protein VFB07_05780 [Vicinamibacterales bacterium]|nr:hypothetical protein [Vicinamibacterales bacterium]
MDVREFLEELEHLDPPADDPTPVHEFAFEELDANMPAIPSSPPRAEPAWVMDAPPAQGLSGVEPRERIVWMACGFVLGAATAVVVFHHRVAEILRLLR